MRLRRCALILAVLAPAGCAVGPSYRVPKPDLPQAFTAHVAQSGADIDLGSWWKALKDTELDSLVERAVKSNLDLQVALDRLQAARTYEAVVLGRAVPEVDATGAAAKGTGSDLARGRTEQGLVSADNSSGLQHINTIAGFDAVWELDLFGKFRREFEAASADADAARAARNDVLTAIIADVVRAYIDLRGLQLRAGVLRQADSLLQESLRIVKIRYERGITNELDVALAARELATLQSQIAPLEAQVSAAQFSLAVLIGEHPEKLVGELSTPALIPSMPAPAAAGVPVDLLKRRPDIQQAERQLAAATARIGVATANLFPQVGVVGAIGSQGQGLGAMPSAAEHIWSFGPAAIWPILDFGALDAQVDIADLNAQSKLAEYRKSILIAVQEVDTALRAYQADEEQLERLGGAVLAGQRAVDLANARYDRGLTDFLNVVDAERQFYELQEQYVQAQVAEGNEFVKLYKSLGGGWQNYQAVPSIRTPQPAILAAFRRLLSASPK
jgi:NodT family efflux transporter outer membrane factor (OMF) lipoprotein